MMTRLLVVLACAVAIAGFGVYLALSWFASMEIPTAP